MNNFIISLYLKGDGLDPDLLTVLLGVDPTQAHRKGSKWTTSSGKQVVEKTGLWAFTANVDENFSEEFFALIFRLTAKAGALNDLPGVEYAYFDIFVATSPGDGGRSDAHLSLDDKCISRLQLSGVPVNITFAAIPE